MRVFSSIRPTTSHWPVLVSVIAVYLVAVGAAVAQQPAVQDEPSVREAASLDTILVTANKRQENIREVAVAVTALDEHQLEVMNATQMSDYATYVPGFHVQSSGTPGKTQVSMRGIAPLSPGSTVGTYVDESPAGSNSLYQQATLYQLDLLPYDVETIEVLRGPQGTLYGAGAMGGLVKYLMRKPDPTYSEFRIGSGVAWPHDGGSVFNYRVGGNVPLVDDRVALRASYARNTIPAWVDNLASGKKDINKGHQTSARMALRWEDGDSSVQFTAMQQKIDSDNNAAIALDADSHRPLAGLANYVYVDEPFRKDLDHYSLTITHAFAAADFTSASSYAKTDTFVRFDVSMSYGEYPLIFQATDPRLEAGTTLLDNALGLKQFTQELRLQSRPGETFEWLLGAFYSHEKGGSYQYVELAQLDGTPLPEPWDDILGVLGELDIPSTYREIAAFANGAWRFNDRFKLGAGVRFSRNDQKFQQNVMRGVLLPIGVEDNTSKEDVFTWSLTPQFQISENSMAYLKASTGYQPGGPNVVVVGLPSAVDSSRLTSYELGWKVASADHRVQLDVAAYQIDWKDIQVASLVNGVSGLVNGGEATSRGVEASLRWRPVDGLTLGLNGAWNHARVDEDFAPIVVPLGDDLPGGVLVINTGLKGDRMPYVPDLTLAATADYYLPLRNGWAMNVGGGIRRMNKRTSGTTERQVIALEEPYTVLQTELTPALMINGYTVLDLYASFSNEHWALRGYVKNAADKRAYSTMDEITGAVTGIIHHLRAAPIQPRQFGIEVDFRF